MRRPSRPARRAAPLAATLGAAGLAFVTAACASDGGNDNATAQSSAPQAPGGEGATLYAAHCASCHGADLRGTDQGPSHLSIVYEPGHHPDDSFRAAIAQGVRAHHWDFGDMAPVEGLTDGEVDAIIAFVRAQQNRHGFEPYPPE